MPRRRDRGRAELQTVKHGSVSAIAAAADAPTLMDRSGLVADASGAEDALVGSLCGKYKLVRLVGRGGMGTVYEGIHQQIQKRAAIKILSREFSLDPVFARRFLDEARAAHIVRHPGLVETLEFDQRQDGMLYLVMEYVDGESLAARLARDTRILESRALSLMLQLARALAAAHDRGVIHRDLKPSNIMLTADPVRPGEWQLKVLDFGIAKLLSTQEAGSADAETIRFARTDKDAVLGTHGYMAPEQYDSSAQVDGKADVFAAGCILFEMITGEAAGKTAAAIVARSSELMQRLAARASSPTVALVRAMLMPEPDQRPTMRALVDALEQLLRPPWLRQRRLLLAGVVALAVISFIAGWLLYQRSSSAVRRRAIAILRDQGLRSSALDTRQHALRLIAQSHEEALAELVTPLVEDSDPRIREPAIKALEPLAGLRHLETLRRVAQVRPVTAAQIFAARAIERLRPGSGDEPLQEALASAPASLRVQADLILFQADNLARTARLKAWFAQFGSSASLPLLADVLSRLVAARDLDALHKLNELLTALPDGPERLRVASLAIEFSSGKEQLAFEILQQTADRTGDLQVQAARYLADLGRTSACALLSGIARQSAQSVSRRIAAVGGLATCARDEDLALLRDLMDEAQPVPALRLEAAGAFLSVLAKLPGRDGLGAGHWLLQAQQSTSEQQRELAMLALGNSDSSDAIDSLQRGLRDPSVRVRLQAIRSLARKSTRSAVHSLQQALSERDEAIQSAGIAALHDVVTGLVRSGDSGVVGLVSPMLERMASDPRSPIQASAQGLLVRLGNTRPSSVLAASALSSDHRLKLHAIPWIDDQTILSAGLADKDLEVRAASALRLAALGSQAGVAVLREVSQAGELLGLRSYAALLRLSVAAPPPPDLDSVLTTAAPDIRSQAVELLANLRPDVAATKLRLVMHDASASLRYQAVDVALRVLRKQPDPAIIEVLQASLHQEPESLVRIQIQKALQHVAQLRVQERSSHGNTGRPSTAESLQRAMQPPRGTENGPHVSSPTLEASATLPQPLKAESGQLPRGTLLISGPKSLRVRINEGNPLTLPAPAQTVGPGIYRISFVGGSRVVTVQPGQRVAVSIPNNAVLSQLYAELPSVSRLQVVDEASFNADRLAMFERKVEQAPGDPALKQNLLLQVALQYDAYGYTKRACAIYSKLSNSEVAASLDQDGRLTRARAKCATPKANRDR